MDFEPNQEQRALAERAFELGSALNGGLAERVRAGRFDRDMWRRCGEFGLLGLSVPTADGGLGLDSLSTSLVIEAFAKGCQDMGLLFSACAHLFACAMPIAEHGGPELRTRLLPRLISGEWIAANAITEPEAGSDVHALRTTAIRDGADYVLNGVKSFVTNGPIADHILVYASTNPADGHLGLSAFVVDRHSPGLTAGPSFAKPGLTTSPLSPIYLDDCRVPAANRLGAEGAGSTIFSSSMAWERTCLFAAYLGSMDRQLTQTIAHVRTRRQFRKPLSRHQAVAHRIADMKLRLEGARLLLYRACARRDRGVDSTLEVSLAKLAVSEAAIQNALDAIQLHGATGFLSEGGVVEALGDALPSTIFSGTSEIHRDLIARGLGL
ncbi:MULTISPECIES: acyl-CoA dehydrogenase family protein [unclassified Crossiella]|uniref:acyl-CoA dehydrogenase family protein n=1 Tax=unclassified Crossiella TaxID=2620835 RepID=UPI001FFFF951|nr:MULTISPECIES: acyl-CoA dehydrogenase family protein [unclassified Crossiella]MCK2244210.1 acyl-CoA dehydrogenase family protein [Crossiella sp. S99.2]MCK2258014.1 acyl-CoA dehydrogenase family protein [Crossiella sp. S99.1]